MPKFRRRPPAASSAAAGRAPSIHRLSSVVSIAPRQRKFHGGAPLRAQDRAHAVGGDGRLDSGREVEADRIGRGFADLLAALGDQLVGAAQLLAVIAEHQAALVDQAEAADVAVVAGLEAARVIVLGAVDGDVLDALAERAVGQDAGRIGVGKDQRAVRRGRAQPSTSSSGSSVGSGPGPPQLTTSRCAPSDISNARVEAEPRAAIFCGRRRRGVEDEDRAERRQPLIAPAARLAQRAGAKAAAFDQRGEPRGIAGIAALPARQRAVAHGRLHGARRARPRRRPRCRREWSAWRRNSRRAAGRGGRPAASARTASG